MEMHGNFFYKRLGESVAAQREKKKISQEKLAFSCCLDRTYIARIERGRANPTVRVLYKIARSMKVKLSQLLKGV